MRSLERRAAEYVVAADDANEIDKADLALAAVGAAGSAAVGK